MAALLRPEYAMSSSNISLVLTAIGDDRPGLVEQLATAISRHQGNWLESSMSHLSGKFAGIVRVSVPATQLEALKSALAELTGLRVKNVQTGAMQEVDVFGVFIAIGHKACVSPPKRANHRLPRRQPHIPGG